MTGAIRATCDSCVLYGIVREEQLCTCNTYVLTGAWPHKLLDPVGGNYFRVVVKEQEIIAPSITCAKIDDVGEVEAMNVGIIYDSDTRISMLDFVIVRESIFISTIILDNNNFVIMVCRVFPNGH